MTEIRMIDGNRQETISVTVRDGNLPQGGFEMRKRTHIKHSKRYYKVRRTRQLRMIGLFSFCTGLAIFLIMTSMGRAIRLRLYGLMVETNQYVQQKFDQGKQEILKVEPLFYRETSARASYDNQLAYVKVSSEDIYKGSLILVNGNHAALFLEDDQLVDVDDYKNQSYKTDETGIRLNKKMVEALNQMMADFEKSTDKHDLILISGYRSMQEQEEEFQQKISLFGEEHAARWAMKPGYSEHHTGYAVDISIYTDEGKSISYTGQGDYEWINKNCYKYGIIRRYTDEKKEMTSVTNEEWHYRYIGIPHAHIVLEKNFCLEEYIEYLKQYSFDKTHLQVTCENKTYEIYYVPSKGAETMVPVPRDKAYNLSGNNEDGFIVTVTLS